MSKDFFLRRSYNATRANYFIHHAPPNVFLIQLLRFTFHHLHHFPTFLQLYFDRYLLYHKISYSKFEFTLSYLDEEWTDVNFTVFRWYPVANMSQWHLIMLYDYYEPTITTQRLYSVIGQITPLSFDCYLFISSCLV